MFPNMDTVTKALTSDISGGKKSFLFDFIKGEFVIRDGRPAVCSGQDALKVWIEKILHTEKDRFAIYLETEYGCRLEDLIVGSNYPVAFIEAELKREIEEALMQNKQITEISGFSLNRSANLLTVRMEVHTRDEGTNLIETSF